MTTKAYPIGPSCPWPKAPGEIQAWVTGQSYAKDAQVTHGGKTWLSMVDNNVWEPGAAGVYESIWKEAV